MSCWREPFGAAASEGFFFEKNLPDIPDGKKLAYIQFNMSIRFSNNNLVSIGY